MKETYEAARTAKGYAQEISTESLAPYLFVKVVQKMPRLSWWKNKPHLLVQDWPGHTAGEHKQWEIMWPPSLSKTTVLRGSMKGHTGNSTGRLSD